MTVQFLPKYNAVQDVYAAKTDLMVPVGVPEGGEPTPEPEPETFHFDIKVVKNGYGYNLVVTSNIAAPVENPSVYIMDEPVLDGCEGDYAMAFYGHFTPKPSNPLEWESEDYSYDEGEIEDNCGYSYVATADWIEGTVTAGTTTYEHSMSGTWELVN